MPDLEDENPSPISKPQHLEHPREQSIMDLDLDLDCSWSLEQISMSPLFMTSFEQPCSPLWVFSDGFEDKFLPPASATAAGAIRLSDYPRLLTFSFAIHAILEKVTVTKPMKHEFCSSSNSTNLETENGTENEENRNNPTPLLGLTPLENPDGFCVIKQRMTQALRKFKESTEVTEQHILAQVWAPVKKGNRYVLTTSGQPFVLDPGSNGLHGYRLVSIMYMFSVDSENEGELGLPGRVFRQKVPEWTPDVQYYSSKEYSRLNHALHYNVHGTLALPVFEPTGQTCIGVLELIMTSQKINYAPEVDKVCKALEAVNLKSSEILDRSNTQICNEGRQVALAEILEILTVVCESHKLPLAQTWVPCRHSSVLADGGGLKKSCSSFDGSCMGQVCMSTTDVACYIVDANVWGFREACLEHHLQKGQGVAGRAFSSRGSCFCRDITQFCKTQYPLVHYARLFRLTSCFAICLRSSFTGNDEYILEFFLPPSMTDSYEQQALLGSLLSTMKQHFKSLRVASGKELEQEEKCIEIVDASMIEALDSTSPEPVQLPNCAELPSSSYNLPYGREMDKINASKQQTLARADANAVANDDTIIKAVASENVASCSENKPVKKKSEKKRGKAEKQISLDVLQQYFAGSLKDAAKSLGVCPTTMKRICRQHGISRWPSRKINKVNRSLSKLKRVIESVQGAEEAFGLGSLATSPLPVAVGSISWPSNLKGSNEQSPPEPKASERLGENTRLPSPKTPGSDEDAGVNNYLLRRFSSQEQLVYELDGIRQETLNVTNHLKTGSGSREESSGTPTSHGSCQGSPVNNEGLPTKSSPDIAFNSTQELNFPTPYVIPNGLPTTELQEPFGGMLIEDAGSSKDLKKLCPSVADAVLEDWLPESSWTNPPCNNLSSMQPVPPLSQTLLPQTRVRQDMKSITIKATYREDIIRFRISVNSNIVELKEQVAKRLKLEVGTFDIKYLDDDHEWVLIACDADWQECVDISWSSGSNMIRLLVHDAMSNLGSSCESSGE